MSNFYYLANPGDGANAMKKLAITLFDLELTGLDPVQHEIIEIGAYILEQPTLAVRETFEAKVKPEHVETADPESLKIAGYNEEQWQNARPLKEVLAEFAEKGRGTILCGQNVAFDFAFLRKALAEQNVPFRFHHHVLDVMSMAFLKWYNHETIERFGLTEMTTVLGVDRGQAHRALEDVKATYEVLKKLWPGFGQ